MGILGYICVLVVACFVLDFCKKVLDDFVGFLLVEGLEFLEEDFFGCVVLVFGWFRMVFCVLGLCLLFGLGFKFLGFGWQWWGFSQILCVFGGVSSDLRNGFSPKNGFDGDLSSKIESCKCGWLNSLMKSNKFLIGNLDENSEGHSVGGEGEDEVEEFDVVKLRKLLKIEKSKANVAYMELEKERMAAKTAAEETMAMILRLQNDRSLVEMEAKQYKRLAEEKQLHDQAVIQSLRWIVMKHESEWNHLKDLVRLLQRKLKLLELKNDEGDQSERVESIDESLSFHSVTFEDDREDGLVSSLDMCLSTFTNEVDNGYRIAASNR